VVADALAVLVAAGSVDDGFASQAASATHNNNHERALVFMACPIADERPEVNESSEQMNPSGGEAEVLLASGRAVCFA